MLFAAAAISFWILASKRTPPSGENLPDRLEQEAPSRSSPSSDVPGSNTGAGKDDVADAEFAEGHVRSPYVDGSAAKDGVLRLLILGDEQASSWGESAATQLQERLRESAGDWSEVEVELTLEANVGWSAAEAWEFLELGGWDEHRPELVLLSFGWYDAARPRAGEVPATDAATRRLTGLAKRAVFSDRAVGEHDFYLRRALEGLKGEHLSPQHHLELLDAVALRGAENGAAVLYVEQPALHHRKERRVFATTAARPQPWLGTVFSMEQRADVDGLFSDNSPIALCAEGAAHLGRTVGLGAAPAVLGIGRRD